MNLLMVILTWNIVGSIYAALRMHIMDQGLITYPVDARVDEALRSQRSMAFVSLAILWPLGILWDFLRLLKYIYKLL